MSCLSLPQQPPSGLLVSSCSSLHSRLPIFTVGSAPSTQRRLCSSHSSAATGEHSRVLLGLSQWPVSTLGSVFYIPPPPAALLYFGFPALADQPRLCSLGHLLVLLHGCFPGLSGMSSVSASLCTPPSASGHWNPAALGILPSPGHWELVDLCRTLVM